MPTPPKHTAHSPTPWSTEGVLIWGKNHNGIIADCDCGSYRGKRPNANAALIVHRVNAFDGLVEALEKIKSLADWFVLASRIDPANPIPQCAETFGVIARAALKQAKEG